jgi:hypothetical protein
MNIIPGYWDPKELRFIEEPEALDILRLRVVNASNGESSRDDAAAGTASGKKQK